jgi:hypothetical protein
VQLLGKSPPSAYRHQIIAFSMAHMKLACATLVLLGSTVPYTGPPGQYSTALPLSGVALAQHTTCASKQ